MVFRGFPHLRKRKTYTPLYPIHRCKLFREAVKSDLIYDDSDTHSFKYEPRFVIRIMGIEGTFENAYRVVEEEMEIKFCPFCGKKLRPNKI